MTETGAKDSMAEPRRSIPAAPTNGI